MEKLSQGYRYSWMLVPQGNNLREWITSLDNFSVLLNVMTNRAPDIFSKGVTLGISKDYEVFEGGLYSLLEDYAIPWANEYGAAIHMLGWGRDLWAIHKIAEDFGDRIRSIDSAKPFVYGMHDVKLEYGKEYPAYPKRDSYYFEQYLSFMRQEVFWSNITAFEAAALDGRV